MVPLNGAHVRRAVALHRAAAACCYRGKKTPAVLWAFYDAYANREETAGTAAFAEDDGRLVGVVCGTVSREGPRRWLTRRRRFRSLAARLAAGPDLARGGWPPASLAPAGGAEGKPGFIVALVTAPEMTAEEEKQMVDTFAAAMASRGAMRLYAPVLAPGDERFRRWGFERALTAPVGVEDGVMYVRQL